MPFPRMPSYMTEFQFSPVMIWNTVTADHRSVSKLLRGTCQKSKTRLEWLEMSLVLSLPHKLVGGFAYRSLPEVKLIEWRWIAFVVEAHRIAEELAEDQSTMSSQSMIPSTAHTIRSTA